MARVTERRRSLTPHPFDTPTPMESQVRQLFRPGARVTRAEASFRTPSSRVLTDRQFDASAAQRGCGGRQSPEGTCQAKIRYPSPVYSEGPLTQDVILLAGIPRSRWDYRALISPIHAKGLAGLPP